MTAAAIIAGVLLVLAIAWKCWLQPLIDRNTRPPRDGE